MGLALKPRLLVLLSDSPTKPCGGLGVRFRAFLPALATEYDIKVACFGPEGGECAGVPVHAFDRRLPHAVGAAMPLLFLEQVAAIVGDWRPDIVLCADHFVIRAALIVARMVKAKLVVEFDLALYSYQKQYTQESLTADMRAQSDHINEAERVGSEEADLVITCSRAYANELPYRTKRAPVVVLNGIDPDPFARDLGPYEFAGDAKKNFVFMGRFNLQKGIWPLLETSIPPDSALHFVGGQRAGEAYGDVIRACKLRSNFHHIDWVDGDEKIRLLQSAAAVVFPSLHEPFGIVGLEALAAGTILITTMVDGIAEYANDDIAFRCEATPGSIGSVMAKVAALPDDVAYKYGKRGQERAKLFSWDGACANMLQALRTFQQ